METPTTYTHDHGHELTGQGGLLERRGYWEERGKGRNTGTTVIA